MSRQEAFDRFKIIGFDLLYGAELSWNGTKTMEKDVQGLTNRMGRASLGVRQTTLGIIDRKSVV